MQNAVSSRMVNADDYWRLLNNVDDMIGWINERFVEPRVDHVLGVFEGSTQALIIFLHKGLKSE